MSGLEILGAVAGTRTVQPADTCLKIATCAVDLFSRVRDAPETIQKRLEEVKQPHRDCQINRAQFFPSNIINYQRSG